MNTNINYLDGNVAGGELSKIFSADLTAAIGQCANCGARRRFAEAHVYVDCPGLIARCAVCDHVLLRVVNAGAYTMLDMKGMDYVTLGATQQAQSSS